VYWQRRVYVRGRLQVQTFAAMKCVILAQKMPPRVKKIFSIFFAIFLSGITISEK
jgi:hypothetical protein